MDESQSVQLAEIRIIEISKNIDLTAMLTFTWKQRKDFELLVACTVIPLSSCQIVIELIKEELPVYKTRAMQHSTDLDDFAQTLHPLHFGIFNKDLTGDHSAPANLDRSEIKESTASS